MERVEVDVLLVVSDGELEVTRHDTVLLVITGGVASEFEDLGSEVFEDGSEVDYAIRVNTTHQRKRIKED